jgi:serine/threonine protein kinase
MDISDSAKEGAIAKWLAAQPFADTPGLLDALDKVADTLEELTILSDAELAGFLSPLQLKMGKQRMIIAGLASLRRPTTADGGTSSSQSSSSIHRSQSMGASLDLETIRELGRGAFGVTFLARRRASNELVALKRVGPTSLERANKALAEAHAIDKMRHPFLVASLGPPKVESLGDMGYSVSLTLEYCDGGDLMTLVQSSHPLGEGRVTELLAEVLTALEYIHGRGMAHRDIKPGNVLLHHGHLKVADLGLARKIDATNTTAAGAGTLAYMAPEAFDGSPSAATDSSLSALSQPSSPRAFTPRRF